MVSILIIRWIILLGLAFWLLGYWQGGQRVFADIKKAIETPGSKLDAVLMLLILGDLLFLAGGALLVALGVLSAISVHPVVSFLGAVLALGGIVGMFACRRALGRFWTAETTLMPGHQVVDEGPYRVVRHPIYTCAILTALGVALAFPHWWNILAAGMVILGYGLKAREEDQFLALNLPDYAEYRRRVPHLLIPWIL